MKVFLNQDKPYSMSLANVTPPKSYADWAALIENFASHLIGRYGAEVVENWNFEGKYSLCSVE
jgi:beta-xylosidase